MTSERPLFAEPPAVLPPLESCSFYHTMELPGHGIQHGSWDLRHGFDAYFGGHDFTGERVLDIGTSSGALAFEIERRGAREVVGFDLDDDLVHDCRLPTDDATRDELRTWVRRVKNAFWVSRAALGSRVKVAYGHAGRLPEGLGRFDTVVMGNILQHLQDPVGAVLQAIRHTDHLIVTEADWLPGTGDDLACMVMYDLPHPFSWYQVKPKLLQILLQRWGFSNQTVTRHTQTILRAPVFDEQHRVSWKTEEVPTPHYTLSALRSFTR
jgi:SAM-dependent methyltransferase